jgi:hypothetical protein
MHVTAFGFVAFIVVAVVGIFVVQPVNETGTATALIVVMVGVGVVDISSLVELGVITNDGEEHFMTSSRDFSFESE